MAAYFILREIKHQLLEEALCLIYVMCILDTDLTIHVDVCVFATLDQKSEQFYFFQYYLQTDRYKGTMTFFGVRVCV